MWFLIGSNVGLSTETDGYFPVYNFRPPIDQELEEEDFPITAVLEDNNSADPELLRLKRKMEALDKELSDIKVVTERARENTSAVKLTNSLDGDTELEALREKYQNAFGVVATSNETNQVQDKGDSELDRMKERFNRANTRNERPAEKARPEEDIALQSMKERFNRYYNDNEPALATVPSDEYTPVSFDELTTEVLTELDADLGLSTRQQLKKELISEVQTELIPVLKPEERKILSEAPVTENTLSALERDFDRYYQESKLKSAERDPQEIQAFKEELRADLEPEVREELKKSLRDEVKEELRRELAYQIKLEIEDNLREELEAKIQDEYAEKARIRKELEKEDEPEFQEVSAEVVLVPIKVGQIIPLENIFFDANEATLKEASFLELKRVFDFLSGNPELIVEVGGHTNGWCSHSFAKELSTDRAGTVAEYLISQGIPANRIKHHGYGKTQPIASNDNAAGRKKNQRVELKIVEILE